GQADKSGSKQYELPILVKIPSGVVTFLRRDEVMESRLRIYLAVQDEKNRPALVHQVPYPLSVPVSEMEDGDIIYQTTLRIRPGPQTIAAGVWDEISGTESFVNEPVVVGESKRSNR
ncbi:MAG: hypothetical protein GY856_20835, partial [bacterium]|nr:hypothetical protein [bacterium]